MTKTLALVVARLQERAIPFQVVPIGSGVSVVVSQLGARVYGPFFDDGEAEGWIPDAFDSATAFAELVESGFWNVGGERLWVGPEIAYMIPDRSDYWGSYDLPASIDPGDWSLDTGTDAAFLSTRMAFRRHIDPFGEVDLATRVRVLPRPHPLRHLRGMDDTVAAVRYGGYCVDVQTEVVSAPPEAEIESWTLMQVRPGGVALVPMSAAPQVTDYYEPVGSRLTEVDGGVLVELTGAHRFKLGFSAPQVTGRLGHVRRVAGDEIVLTVRVNAVDASAEYSEEPDFSPGIRGDAMHLYNDDGGLGGFAELEARGLPIEHGFGPIARDRFTTWVFRGPAEPISAVAQTLLGLGGDAVGRALASTAPPV